MRLGFFDLLVLISYLGWIHFLSRTGLFCELLLIEREERLVFAGEGKEASGRRLINYSGF